MASEIVKWSGSKDSRYVLFSHLSCWVSHSPTDAVCSLFECECAHNIAFDWNQIRPFRIVHVILCGALFCIHAVSFFLFFFLVLKTNSFCTLFVCLFLDRVGWFTREQRRREHKRKRSSERDLIQIIWYRFNLITRFFWEFQWQKHRKKIWLINITVALWFSFVCVCVCVIATVSFVSVSWFYSCTKCD